MKSALSEEARKSLGNDLIKLGDMLGDGLGDEPDGAWIAKEYRRVAKALGYGPPRVNNNIAINTRMLERVKEVPCQACGGALKQTRSGSTKAQCASCKSRFRLLTIKRPKK